MGICDAVGRFRLHGFFTCHFQRVDHIIFISRCCSRVAQLEELNAKLDLKSSPRDHNVGADALTNLDFAGFSMNHRIELDIEQLEWKFLEKYVGLGSSYFRLIREAEKIKKGQVLSNQEIMRCA